jgi:hypothetical protein
MPLVTAASIKEFANIFPDTDTIVDEVEKSAEEIVIGYLGFSPISAAYSHDVTGLGDDELYLSAFPIAGGITIDGTVHAVGSFFSDLNVVSVPDFYFPYKEKVAVAYTAGFALASIPAIILHTITQIAALLLTERGNIGISGMSDANTGSRTFISYTNFDKYLKNLKQYRLRKPLI